MPEAATHIARCRLLPDVVIAALVSGAILAICLLAPTENTMGDAQRILYLHVSVAWFSLASFLLMAGAGLMYLVRRSLEWDHWSHSAAEVGWLCSGLTLATGSLWAHEAWGTWWSWDPRLTTAFILWAIYSGCLLVRTGVEDPHRRARLGAVLAILGVLDVPLVVLATRWFRGIHPVAPPMEPAMRMALIACLVGFSALFALLLVRRRVQLRLECLTGWLEHNADMEREAPAMITAAGHNLRNSGSR